MWITVHMILIIKDPLIVFSWLLQGRHLAKEQGHPYEEGAQDVDRGEAVNASMTDLMTLN